MYANVSEIKIKWMNDIDKERETEYVISCVAGQVFVGIEPRKTRI